MHELESGIHLEGGPGHPYFVNSRSLTAEGVSFFSFQAGHEPPKVLVSDGTPGGTHPLDGLPSAGIRHVNSFQEFDGAMYFLADSVRGYELWMSEGARAWPVDERVRWSSLVATPKGLILTGYAPEVGIALWVIDEAGAAPRWLATAAGSLSRPVILPDGRSLWYNVLPGELWITDGTEAGTKRLLTIRTPTTFFQYFFSGDVVQLGNVVFFQADDGIEGWEVWRTDGTPEGTELAVETCPGSCSKLGPSGLHKIGNRIAFTTKGSDGEVRLELFDGTPGGIQSIDLCPDVCGVDSVDWYSLGDIDLAWITSGGWKESQIYQFDPLQQTLTKLTSSPPELWLGYPTESGSAFFSDRVIVAAMDEDTGREPWVVQPLAPPVTAVPTSSAVGYGALICLLAMFGFAVLGAGRT